MSLSYLSKSAIIAQAMGVRPSTESADPTTTEVGSSQDAQIQIEELKRDNQIQMDIAALEEDASSAERIFETTEDLQGASEEVSEIRQNLESSLEAGGLTKDGARYLQTHLKSISKRIGLENYSLGLESFAAGSSVSDRIDMTVSCEASVGELSKNIMEAIKKTFEIGKAQIKMMVSSFSKSADSVNEKIDSVLKSLEDKKDELSSEVNLPTNAFMEDLKILLDASNKMVNSFEKTVSDLTSLFVGEGDSLAEKGKEILVNFFDSVASKSKKDESGNVVWDFLPTEGKATLVLNAGSYSVSRKDVPGIADKGYNFNTKDVEEVKKIFLAAKELIGKSSSFMKATSEKMDSYDFNKNYEQVKEKANDNDFEIYRKIADSVFKFTLSQHFVRNSSASLVMKVSEVAKEITKISDK